MAVRFRLLGDVEAHLDGVPVDLGHPKQRGVLAVMLVEANRVVPTDRLLDRVWGEHPPTRGRETLYNYLSRLRAALSATDEVRLVRRSGGYQLTVDEQTVDLHRFHRLLARARASTHDQDAVELFDQALRLWRGEPLPTLDTPWVIDLRATLEGERLAAELDHIDLALRCGRHAELLPDLFARATRHALDERVAAQLMLALYRSGRQADALEHYRQTRIRLAEALGIDPGTALRGLHQQILAADTALAGPPSAIRPATSFALHQLPTAPRLFVGRAEELATLSATLNVDAKPGTPVVISAIGGVGGIGKTWLALHWAHRNLGLFPDGQLFVNLRGFDPSTEPMPPAVALRGFLHALGVDPATIPADEQAAAGRYRSLVDGKRMLIVLDNVRDSTQATLLLPGSPTCTVLITSRSKLTGLVTTHGAHQLSLGMLDEGEARLQLTARLGVERMTAESVAVEELLQRCAGLPLALGMLAARATNYPNLPLGVLADELRDHADRLDALDTGDTDLDLRTVFSSSFRALTADAAVTFRLFGLAPWPEHGLPAIASLTGQSTARTGVALRELENAHLIAQPLPGRYRMHDLVRLYAAERAEHDLPESDQDTAMRGLVDFYLHTAYNGDRLLTPQRTPIELGDPTPGCCPNSFDDEAAVLTWFDVEHPGLLAIQRRELDHGSHTQVWQLAWTLDNYHWRRGHLDDRLATWQLGLESADHLADPVMQGQAHRLLGQALSRLGRKQDALHHLNQALARAEESGDVGSLAYTHNYLAETWAGQGDNHQALKHATDALRLFQLLDKPSWQADASNTVGWLCAQLGDYEQARAHCRTALVLYRSHGRSDGEPGALDSLGYIAHHTGQHTDAFDYYQQALTLFRELGNSYEEANTLVNLGDVHQALGHDGQALDVWREALELYRKQRRTTEADGVQRRISARTFAL